MVEDSASSDAVQAPPHVPAAAPEPPSAPPAGASGQAAPAVKTANGLTSAAGGVPDISLVVEELRKRVLAASRRGASVSSISVEGTAVLFSPNEVDAFLHPDGASAADFQRSLAARVLLIQALEVKKRGTPLPFLKALVEVCRAEATTIQQHSAESKQASKGEMAAQLANSANQLLAIVRQAERAV